MNSSWLTLWPLSAELIENSVPAAGETARPKNTLRLPNASSCGATARSPKRLPIASRRIVSMLSQITLRRCSGLSCSAAG